MLRGFYTLMILFCCSTMATAAQVTYSWTGTVDTLQGSLDSWNVGPTGQPFTLTVTVDQSTPDSSANVGIAQFDVLALQFSIAGVAALNVDFGASILEFTDNVLFGTMDVIEVSFAAELNGHTESFGTSVSLPSGTFAFLQDGESPPVFGTVNTSLVSGHFLQQYMSNTGIGVPVTSTVVPEPSTYVLAVTALAALAWVRRRKR